jgi:cobalt-zinc-cadmium efflux system protein
MTEESCDHSHHRQHIHAHTNSSYAISKAILITAFFMGVELVGGWFSNSLALISDAAHMLIDIGAMLLSLFALWIARRPSTLTMSFGYHRAEVIGALLSGVLIWIISGSLIYEAVVRMQSPPEVKGPWVFIIAVIGLIANIASMKILHAEKHENLNIRAAYLHLFADLLGSIGAIIAGGILWVTDWRPIDPIITIFFAALMLFSSLSLVKEAIGVLMESTPQHVSPTKVYEDLLKLKGVREAHDLHIWTVSSGKLALSVHLISEEAEFVLIHANQLLQEKYGIVHTTIQVEHPDRFQSERCYDCMPLELRSKE